MKIYFRRNEAGALCDIFNGAHEDKFMSDRDYLFQHTKEALLEWGYADKWRLDGHELLLFLNRLANFTEDESAHVLQNIRSFGSVDGEVSLSDAGLHDALAKAELISPNKEFHHYET